MKYRKTIFMSVVVLFTILFIFAMSPPPVEAIHCWIAPLNPLCLSGGGGGSTCSDPTGCGCCTPSGLDNCDSLCKGWGFSSGFCENPGSTDGSDGNCCACCDPSIIKYSSWGSCSKSCGGGTQTRGSWNDCGEILPKEFQDCNTQACPPTCVSNQGNSCGSCGETIQCDGSCGGAQGCSPTSTQCSGASYQTCSSSCGWSNSGTDADGDGTDVQCGDSNCDNAPGVIDSTQTAKESGQLCFDGLDNDCNGLTDVNDLVCRSEIIIAYWADMNGQEISKADFGDTVQMIITNTASGDFKIKEKDIIVDDNIKTISGISINLDLVGTWTITKKDMDKTNDYDRFYFEVGSNISNYLSINPLKNNNKMNITLVSPNCGTYIDKNTGTEIIVLASDEDDKIDGTLSIDGEVMNNFSNGGVVFNNVFNSPGNSQIMAMATNNRGEGLRVISNIMVLDKDANGYIDRKYTAACITKPKDYSNIQSNVVNFDASSTRAVKVSGGVLDELIPEEGDTFSWYWTFMPENIIRNFVNSNDRMAYKFTAEFPITGENSASLRIEI